jgi:hypothetical protein
MQFEFDKFQENGDVSNPHILFMKMVLQETVA